MLAFYTEEDLQVIKIEETANCRILPISMCLFPTYLSPSPPVRCWSCDNIYIYVYRVPEPTGPVLVTAALTDLPLIICHQSPPVQCWSCDYSSKHTQGVRAYQPGTGYSYPFTDCPIILSPIPTGPVLVM